jgi:hypothetical protein
MARRSFTAGTVQLRLVLMTAKMAKERLSHAAMNETRYLIKIPRAEVREEQMQGVQFPGGYKVKAAILRLPAMLCQNFTPICLPCLNGTALMRPIRWRCKRTDSPPPNQLKQPTPEPTPQPTPPLPWTPPAWTSNNCGAQGLEIIDLLAGYVYWRTSCPGAECFILDTSAQDSVHYTDFQPDMLPDEGRSTG